MKKIYLLLWQLLYTLAATGQPCPPNIDFEQGTLANWQCFIGENTVAIPTVWTQVAPIPNRHTIVAAGSGTDPWGGFPVVSPTGGSYALKLGNDSAGAKTEKVVYNITVPAGNNSYGLIYQYAVVLQDPSHLPEEQPFFRLIAQDALTGQVIACDSLMFVSNSNLPGFRRSPRDNSVLYKDWSKGTLLIRGQAGRQINLTFQTADCTVGGHFGYAYLDVTCGDIAIQSAPCQSAAGTMLTGPEDYKQYSWYNNVYQPIDTGRIIYVHNPPPNNQFNLILTPYVGCADTISVTLPDAYFIAIRDTVLHTPCAGMATGVIQALVRGGRGPHSYQWNTIPPSSSPLASNLAAGTYIFTASDTAGCVNKDTVVLTANPPPAISCSADKTTVCAGSAAQLQAAGAGTYNWSPATGLSCTNCPAPVATVLSTTHYVVTGTDSNGCTNTAGITIDAVLHPLPGVDSTKVVCLGAPIRLGASGGLTYQWSPAATIDHPDRADPLATPTANTTYRVIIRINDCFTDTLYQTVETRPLPVLQIGNGLTGVPGETFTLNPTTNAQSIRWTPPDGLSCTDCFQPVVTLSKDIVYLAEVTDSFGCKATDTLHVDVHCDASNFFMANTFTPNNDGRNDFFFPQAHGVYTVKHFMIYSRWGEIVFSADQIPVNEESSGWNGQYKGRDLPPDVFIYVVETACADGTPVVIKGDVALVR